MRIVFIGRYTEGSTGIVRSIFMGLVENGYQVYEINLTNQPQLIFNPYRNQGGNGPVYVRWDQIAEQIISFQPDLILPPGGIPGPGIPGNIEQRLANLERAFAELQATVAQLQEQLQGLLAPIESIRNELLSRIGTTITILTDAGSVTGTLTEVGDDYVLITEPNGNLVYIPLTSINGFA